MAPRRSWSPFPTPTRDAGRFAEPVLATKLLHRPLTMAELDAITESLRQHRKDLDEQCDQTASRATETARLLDKIEDLRRRSEATTRAFAAEQPPDSGNT